jgi:hypothetical protein
MRNGRFQRCQADFLRPMPRGDKQVLPCGPGPAPDPEQKARLVAAGFSLVRVDEQGWHFERAYRPGRRPTWRRH